MNGSSRAAWVVSLGFGVSVAAWGCQNQANGESAVATPSASATHLEAKSTPEQVAMPSATVAPPVAPAVELAPGSVLPGRTGDDRYWLDGFTYSLPSNPTTWLSFVEARDKCRGEGLDVCSLQQLDRMCRADPAVARLETWTTNYMPDGTARTHGGTSCGEVRAVAPSEQSPTRGVLCCERRPAIALARLQKSDAVARAASVYMTMVEKAMNSRVPEDVTELAADSFYLYSEKKLRTRDDAARAMRFDLTNGTEFDTRLVACSASISQAGQHGEFECESVTTRKMSTKQFRDLGMLSLRFRFIPPRLKYDTWAVGTKIVRNFTPIE